MVAGGGQVGEQVTQSHYRLLLRLDLLFECLCGRVYVCMCEFVFV